MTSTKIKIKFAVGLVLLLSLPSSMTPTAPAMANPGTVKWLRANIPSWGKGNGDNAKVLLDMGILEADVDGATGPDATLYTGTGGTNSKGDITF